MSLNKNNDIIDAEFVIEGRTSKNKKNEFIFKPNSFVVLLLSPIIAVLVIAALVLFCIAFLLFMPKILKLIRSQSFIFKNRF